MNDLMEGLMRAAGRMDLQLSKMAHADRMYQRNKQHVAMNIETMSIAECVESCKTQDALYLISIGEKVVS